MGFIGPHNHLIMTLDMLSVLKTDTGSQFNVKMRRRMTKPTK